MPDDIKTSLEAALTQLKTNLKMCSNNVMTVGGPLVVENTEVAIAPAIQHFEKLANETIEIIEADIDAPNEKTKTFFSLHREAMLNHYLEVVNALNAAITETDHRKMVAHREKLQELARVSKPRIKAALNGLASACAFLATALLSREVTLLIAIFCSVNFNSFYRVRIRGSINGDYNTYCR